MDDEFRENGTETTTGKADAVNVGGRVVGRDTFEPRLAVVGEHQADRRDRLMSGLTPRLLNLRPDEGLHGRWHRGECGPGDVVAIPPGHDAEVVGDGPCVLSISASSATTPRRIGGSDDLHADAPSGAYVDEVLLEGQMRSSRSSGRDARRLELEVLDEPCGLAGTLGVVGLAPRGLFGDPRRHESEQRRAFRDRRFDHDLPLVERRLQASGGAAPGTRDAPGQPRRPTPAEADPRAPVSVNLRPPPGAESAPASDARAGPRRAKCRCPACQAGRSADVATRVWMWVHPSNP
jgi:hypothetical protein